ncbi:LytTR family DNA-binding domain-containing protein [Wandonia haliotis]|uniref:LytTR family DNA-binding domain-containing protein n=1 Tax=Wandonia haliotis TaxID=574963 RepID=A0ABN1MN12_9FLAO
MEQLNAFIIDDEEAPRKLLKYLFQREDSSVNVIGEADRLIAGLTMIKELEIDILFLDIEMPDHKGLEILNLMDEVIDFEIIFVTAYSDYAIDAIKLSAFDYLLKPIQPEELFATISRLQEKRTKKRRVPKLQLDVLQSNLQPSSDKTYFLRTHKEDYIIPTNAILYLEADGMYTHIVMEKERITASKPLKEILEELPKYIYRTHRSFAINLQNISSPIRMVNNCIELTNKDLVPLSVSRKDGLMDFYSSMNS